MAYRSQAELAGLLMWHGFRLFRGYKEEVIPHFVAAGVRPLCSPLEMETEQMLLSFCGVLERTRGPYNTRQRFYIRIARKDKLTLALDEFDRYWVADGHKNLHQFAFAPAQRRLAG